MPPRTAAKPRTTAVKPAEPSAPEPVEEEAEQDDNGPLILVSSTAEEKPAIPVEVFRIDGQPFFINAANPVQTVLKAMAAMEDKSTVAGLMSFIKLTAGPEALRALLNHADVSTLIIARAANKIMSIAQGDAGPGKP